MDANKWTVDLANCTASHATGLQVKFIQAEDDPRAWDGVALNDDIWFSNHFKTMPAAELQQHLARLLREAGEAYSSALRRRH